MRSETLKRTDMRQMKEHRPKFKVGDKVKHIWGKAVVTVVDVTDKGYRMEDDEFVDFEDEFFWELVNEPKREHKFILGDIVVRAKHGVYGDRYFIQRIDDDCYIAYPYGVGGDLSDREYKIWYNEEDEWELFSDAVRLSTEPEPKFKLGVDLNEIPHIDTIWKDTLTNLIGDITKRNTAAFVWLIDETLKHFDCDAYVDDGANGIRTFVKELKKRLGL